MIKNFLMKKLIKSKMPGVSDEQVNAILELVDKNPDLFKKIQKEIEAKKKVGISESAAAMTVMREHQTELAAIMQGLQK
jgi:hypothetical protein